MGYTHDFKTTGEIPRDAWTLLLSDTKKLAVEAMRDGMKIAFDDHMPRKKPQLDPNTIRFNGVGGDGYETFSIRREGTDDCCKTAHTPYDKVVCAVLACLLDRAPNYTKITSDGDAEDWQPHIEWAETVLGRKLINPIGLGPLGKLAVAS